VTAANLDAGRGVYGISVAAELTGVGVQTLRLYETRGLLEPARSDGGTRRYSADDLDRLRRIGDLVAAGVNLAGIAMVLGLEQENSRLRKQARKNARLARPARQSPPAAGSPSSPGTRARRPGKPGR
jgi:MerR family transcriptional regulator/heat shock protein HspR